MSTTKGDLIEQVMLDVGDRPTDPAIQAVYRTWFDDGLDMICSRWPWLHRREVDTIAVDSALFTSFTFPSTVSEIRALRISDPIRKLIYVDHHELLNREIDLTETGTPTHWYYLGYDPDDEGHAVGLYPRPSEDLTLEYDAVTQTPLPLNDGENIPLPREALGILREFIRAYSYENEGMTELGNAAWARGLNRLERLAHAKGISRPEKQLRIREGGDLAHVHGPSALSRFQAIPE